MEAKPLKVMIKKLMEEQKHTNILNTEKKLKKIYILCRGFMDFLLPLLSCACLLLLRWLLVGEILIQRPFLYSSVKYHY